MVEIFVICDSKLQNTDQALPQSLLTSRLDAPQGRDAYRLNAKYFKVYSHALQECSQNAEKKYANQRETT